MNSVLDNLKLATVVVSPHHNQSSCGNPVVPQPIQPVKSCLVDTPLGNSNCHSQGVVNYKTTLPCNRCNFTPLYVRDICSKKSNGCNVSYNKCVKQLTCNNDSCNYC